MSQRYFISRIRPPFDAPLLRAACCTQNYDQADTSTVVTRLAKEYLADRAFLFASARQGLHCLFMALNVSAEDSVILADFNCRSLLSPIAKCGIRPVFVDVSPSFAYDIDQLHEALQGANVKAVILTHFFGKSCWTPQLKEIINEAAQRGVYVIEDAAHSLNDDEQPEIGRIGQVALFSFGNDKPLSAGKGGMLLVRGPELAAKMDAAYQGLGIRSLEEEQGLLLWHILYSLASKPEFCRSGIPCALVPYACPPESEMAEIMHCLDESTKIDALVKFKSVQDSLRLLKHADHSIGSRVTRRFIKLFRSDRAGTVQPMSPMRMNKLTQRVLSTYLRGGVLARANLRRAENHRCIVERLIDADMKQDSDETRKGALLRYTHVYNTADEAHRAIERAKRVNIEAGCFNWSPLLSSMIGVRRIQPMWALHPSRVVNYPLHPFLSSDDIERVADLITSVKD